MLLLHNNKMTNQPSLVQLRKLNLKLLHLQHLKIQQNKLLRLPKLPLKLIKLKLLKLPLKLKQLKLPKPKLNKQLQQNKLKQLLLKFHPLNLQQIILVPAIHQYQKPNKNSQNFKPKWKPTQLQLSKSVQPRMLPQQIREMIQQVSYKV